MTAARLPQGFRAAGVHCGIKRSSQKQDLSLIVSDRPAVAAGVYTTHRVCAAPVKLDRERTPSADIRAVVVNSGVANACTGPLGDEHARQMSSLAANHCACRDDQVLVLSTGVIGEHLPMDKVASGIAAAATTLGNDEQSLADAARGMLTTDTVRKVFCRELSWDGPTVRITGLAKGAAMIGPHMATMLAVVLTDAPLRLPDAHTALLEAVDESFHCISVDGHTSTNDSVLLLANGAAADNPLTGDSLRDFRGALNDVCEELAQSIPADGEGASHLVTVEVHGCENREDATRIAKVVSESPLVKTAIAGNDPNWGRIVSAAGYAGVAFDPEKMSLHINGLLVYERGSPANFDPATVSDSMAADRNVSIVLLFDQGTCSARFWTTDLTAEYVRLNAEYHT